MKKLSFEDCFTYAEKICIIYSISKENQRIIFDYAMKVPRGGVIFEVGFCHGRTASILVCTTKITGAHYHGVDDLSLGANGTVVRSHLDKIGIPYTLYISDSRTLTFTKKIDLLIIDGAHYEAVVKVDCAKYCPLVKKGGVAIFDDYIPKPDNAGAHWAIREYADKYTRGWENLGYFKRIQIFRRPL